MIEGYEWYSAPNDAFKRQGKWKGWGDFLGNGKRFKLDRSPEEWVPVAEQLAVENNGSIPHSKWLESNGYSGLSTCIRKFPLLFAHLAQDDPHGHHRSPEQWVAPSESLANEHGGVLPSAKWLRINGHSGMGRAMRMRPELFKHLVQHQERRSVYNLAVDAEQLSVDHGGVMPYSKWLQRNGFNSIDKLLRRKHPCFCHIKQESRDSHGKVITPWEATYDADDPTRPKGAKITKPAKNNRGRDLEARP